MHTLLTLLRTRWYWSVIAAFGLMLLGVALYYQYVVGDEPCQVCIHARLWVCLFTVIGFVMSLCPQTKLLRLLGNVGVLVAAVGLAERARFLYRLENGIGDGSCEFLLGMPSWFAVDRWIPWLFEVRNLCSFTPTMPLGLSMAEALVFLAMGLCVWVVGVILIDLRPQGV